MNSHTTYTPITPNSPEYATLKLASDYALSVFDKHEAKVHTLLAQYPLNSSLTDSDISELVTNTLAQLTDEKTFKQQVRQLRALLMLRWIWQDALGNISVEQLTHELTVFADTCLLAAKHFVYEKLIIKYGEPYGKSQRIQDLMIVAMGKMGAGELNLSSDIDLVFLYETEGKTAAKDSDQTTHIKIIETKRFMLLWGQQIIRLLDDVTPDGFVFRIDMRLRPWGDGSDLAINLNALKNYFQKHGRAWERFAWLKARVVCGLPTDTEKLYQLIQQFVFRYYVDYTAFSALREMKNMIMHQQRQRGDEDNIKLGAGGIRDIEFVVQAYQLIHGGRKSDLQAKQCLVALNALANHGMITHAVAEELKTAYLFLRRVEHGIQALQDKQTQKLPTAEKTQARLAQVLGFTNWHSFYTALQKHRDTVSLQFQKMVADREVVEDDHISHDEARDIVAKRLNEQEQHVLDNFLSSNAVTKLSAKAKERLQDLWPELIKAIACSDNPSVAATRLLRFIEAILNRSIYLVLLKENPDGTMHLARMMVASPWIANELTRYPVLLDEFLLNRKKELPSKEILTDRLRQRLLRIEPEDEEAQITAIRLFKKTELLHIAAKDVLANKALMKVSDGLTWTAEAVLTQALKLTYANLTRTHGFPLLKCPENGSLRADSNHNGFGIIAYGKLGGLELSYGSDLDLVFLHRIDEAAETNGERPISGLKFITRLAKKLITMLTTQTRDGRAYEIDMRLRPSGAAGVMVSSLNAFETYQENKAWLWEHQALVRARAICGDAEVTEQFNSIRHHILCKPRNQEETKAEVIKMRKKMQAHLGSSAEDIAAGNFHVKHDAGGIVDIEFLAQYAVLAMSHHEPALTEFPDNVRIFDILAKTDFMTKQDADTLTQHYLTLRSCTHRQALAEKNRVEKTQDWQTLRQEVIAIWNAYFSAEN